MPNNMFSVPIESDASLSFVHVSVIPELPPSTLKTLPCLHKLYLSLSQSNKLGHFSLQQVHMISPLAITVLHLVMELHQIAAFCPIVCV